MERVRDRAQVSVSVTGLIFRRESL